MRTFKAVMSVSTIAAKDQCYTGGNRSWKEAASDTLLTPSITSFIETDSFEGSALISGVTSHSISSLNTAIEPLNPTRIMMDPVMIPIQE